MSNWNDGGLPFNSRKVKFYPAGASDASGCTTWTGTAKGIYILESWSPTRPQKVAGRYDETGAPNGAVGTDDFATASAVVQLATTLTVPVDTGDGITTVRRGTGGAAESWVVTQSDEPEMQDGIRKQSVSLRKLVATPSANIPPVYP